MPTRAQLEQATKTVEDARIRLKGQLVIDYVVPDYYAKRPKACMGGWGRQFLNVSPAGKVLPCHAAEAITTLQFDRSEEHTSELQSLMRISYAVFFLQKKNKSYTI